MWNVFHAIIAMVWFEVCSVCLGVVGQRTRARALDTARLSHRLRLVPAVDSAQLLLNVILLCLSSFDNSPSYSRRLKVVSDEDDGDLINIGS